MQQLGFGVAGALDHALIARLAQEAEQRGYTSFWVNDTPSGDSLAALRSAATSTSTIRLGSGVIPVDRKAPAEILGAIADLELPVDRLIVGIGSGATKQGSLELVAASVDELRQGTAAKIAVGALGPRMVQLGARQADAVLLNWLTPAQAERSRHDIQKAGGDRRPATIGYVRAALPSGETRLRQEADRYASFPQYARHFRRMGVDAIDTCALGPPRTLREAIDSFSDALDETVVRAIVGQETADEYLALMGAVAPEN